MKSPAILFALIFGTAQAAPLYNQSFDYGGSTLDFGSDLSGDGWSDNTGVIDYSPSDGLTYANLAGASGGGLVYDYNANANSRNATQSTTFDPFTGEAAGTVTWAFAVGKVDSSMGAGHTAAITFNSDSGVNNFSFHMTDTGASISAFRTTGNSQQTLASSSFSTAGTTTGFLMRITKGTGTSPDDTTVEAWINPDLANLGVADGIFSSDSKLGREGQYSSVGYGFETTGRVVWDEVRMTDNFNDIYAIPEPGTLALVGVALGALALIRRRR